MSNSGQASDLSMDEILASIRKIISEDPKAVAAPPRPTSGPTTLGGNRPVSAPASTQSSHSRPSAPPAAAMEPVAVRAAKPTLDDDILDLMDEDRGPPTPAVPAAPIAAQPAATATTVAEASPPPRPGLNDMWKPREWPRAPEAPPAPSPPASAAKIAPTAEQEGTSESRLEAAIAALGQSLAAPTHNDLPAKPIVVASAPKITSPNGPPPGPRIDVVAVVNAAQRAALAQRSADEQASMPAIVGQHAAAPPAEVAAPTVPQIDPQPSAAPAIVAAAPAVAPATVPASASATAPTTAPATAPSVNAAIAAAMAAARTAPALVDAPKPAAPPVVEAASRPAPPPSVPAPAIVEAAETTMLPPAMSESIAPRRSEGSVSAPAGVQTLEDTVARLLRPMLRQWLDDNMPRIVEKAFKEELAAQVTPPSPPRRAN